MDNKILEELQKVLSYWWLGALGGVAVYLNQLRKWTGFKWSMFFINVILAGWIWWIASQFIPDTLAIKNSIISISGFLAYPILDLLEEKWINLIIEKYLWRNKQ